MQLGMIGLGRMGGNMVRRLMRAGHQCVVSDLSPQNVNELAGEGATGSTSLDDFVSQAHKPRAAWIMVPAGDPTEQTVNALAQRFQAGDIIIDGGNSYYKDDVRRSQKLKDRGIHYIDVGTSGGVWGLERGYCMMLGGPKEAVEHLDPIFKTLAPGKGDIPKDSRTREIQKHRRRRLSLLWAFRRRALREDGAQRHRIWPDAGLCRRL